MAGKAKGGTIAVEITLEKDQFKKDLKAQAREVTAEQSRLSLEMQRNKVKFAVDTSNSSWAEQMFGSTVLGKIQNARKETQQLNQQIGLQQSKVTLARNAWTSLYSIKSAGNNETIKAEKAYLREQMALVGLKNELGGTASAASIAGGALVTAATVGVAAVTALTVAYTAAFNAAVEWGQAVNDIKDETGMSDEESAKLLGTMRIVGLTSEDAATSIAKMAKTVAAASLAQDAAAKSGQDAADVFSKYGIAIKDADGAMLSHSEILANITTVHRSMSDGMAKTAMEMEIFGKTGYKLNDLLNMTADRSEEIAVRLAKMGLSAGLNSQKFEDLNQQLNEAKLAFTSIANTITGDDIPAITSLVAKLSELAIWIRENKDALSEVKDAGFAGFDVAAYPIVKSFELAATAVGKYVEARQRANGMSRVNNPAGDVTDENVAAQDRNIDDARKKNNQAKLDKLKANQELFESAKELNVAIMQLNGQALAVQLAGIDKEEKAWATKTKNQAAAVKWAEAARAKAFEEAQQRIDAGLKTYEASLKSVQSAREGIGSAFQGSYGAAIGDVKLNLQDSTKGLSASAAVQKMKDEFELQKRASREVASAAGYSQEDISKGLFDPMSAQQQIAKAFESLNKAIAEADKQKLDYLKVIALNSAGNKGGNNSYGQNNSNNEPKHNNQPQYATLDQSGNVINYITNHIQRGPNDNEDALAQKVSQKIIQSIEQRSSQGSKSSPN